MGHHVVQTVQCFGIIVVFNIGQDQIQVGKDVVINAQEVLRTVTLVVEPLNAQQRFHCQVLIVVNKLADNNVLLVASFQVLLNRQTLEF